jgi:hypothetical protein
MVTQLLEQLRVEVQQLTRVLEEAVVLMETQAALVVQE